MLFLCKSPHTFTVIQVRLFICLKWRPICLRRLTLGPGAQQNKKKERRKRKRTDDDVSAATDVNDTDGKSLMCIFCSRVFGKGNSLVLHIKSHRDAAYRALADAMQAQPVDERPPTPDAVEESESVPDKAKARKRGRGKRAKITSSKVVPAEDPSELPAVFDPVEAPTAATQAQDPLPVIGPITPLATPPRGSKDSSSTRNMFWHDSPNSHRPRTTTDGSSQWAPELFGPDNVSTGVSTGVT
ncbi:hypothetical protein EUX98_g1402 [Antrodiella citrinella]|uniref:C2H2-type domain-containing protein n=1 Tax=Antrodiella citrinella TaxID=2447956 RepID=A0A4S4N4I5_9APHY|nr:hypothetical protein EUX98_g1402 [Antrodiella citrinella]